MSRGTGSPPPRPHCFWRCRANTHRLPLAVLPPQTPRECAALPLHTQRVAAVQLQCGLSPQQEGRPPTLRTAAARHPLRHSALARPIRDRNQACCFPG
ncbi:hypothetical protein T484DRAFT_1934659 [Baffinella frigidus]|nr:hypothetical protein T484DRAFT_1934659 [Cryptophyta sp. CCMP2293]